MTLESVQWECNVQFALSRTFGNEVDFVQWSWPLCANSNVQNEDLTTLQVSSLYLYLFLLWNGALLWDVSRLSLIWVVPYSCLLLLWHTLPILLNVYLHQNLTTMPIFDLPLSLNVGILPWAGFFPDIICLPGYKRYQKQFYLAPTQHIYWGASS